MGICKTNREIPEHTVPIPRIKIHCVVISIFDFTFKGNTISAYLITSTMLSLLLT